MARKRANQEKQSHGQRTHSALASITPSNNLSADLLKKPVTPLPTSKFSARFQTKGTRSPINRDVLIKPSTRQSKFNPENVPASPDIANFRSATPTKSPTKTSVVHNGTIYNLSPSDYASWNSQTQLVTDATSRNTAKASSLASEVASYNRARGSRSRGGGSGPNGVL